MTSERFDLKGEQQKYFDLTKQILPIGDISQRKKTRLDLLKIAQTRNMSQGTEAIQNLLPFLDTKTDHTMLSVAISYNAIVA